MNLSDGELKQLLLQSGAVKAEALNDLVAPKPGVPATLEPLASLVVKAKLISQPDLDQLIAHPPIIAQPKPEATRPKPKATPKPAAKPTPTVPKPTKETAKDGSIAKTVSVIIEYAVKSRASDIHIEPREDIVQVRYRIDGILHETMTLPKAVLGAVISHIQALSGLERVVGNLPQEGRFTFKLGDQTLVLRVSTLPVMDGDKIVMHIMDENAHPLSLEELGLEREALSRVSRGIHQPHGLVLVTGPNGSGKTATLYSILSLMNAPGVNISTIEDPVEYRLAGVNQTQVETKTGMDLAAGLRSLMSQDPNIIMVSEIHDSETAGLSVQAALTGRVVLSALHTDSAATALSRMLDMGVEPFLVASTIKLVIGQRLARRICTNCRISYTPDNNELTAIKHDFQLDAALKLFRGKQGEDAPKPTTTIPALAPISSEHGLTINPGKLKVMQPERPIDGSDSILSRMQADPNIVNRSMAEAEADRNKASQPEPTPAASEAPVKIDPTKLKGDDFLLYKAGPGCEQCGHNGYLGRIGLYEVLEINEMVSKMIVSRAKAEMMEEAAMREGMVTMKQDGLVKSLEGLTTIEEVLRVTREIDR
jgi:type II secretory ATPase GspE/PulE/Tfp pilus assembly ATPase PilB-like protein